MGGLYKIQGLVWPEFENVNCPDLYFRGKYFIDQQQGEISVAPYDALAFNTYFNSLSLYHLARETCISRIVASIRLTRGKGELRLMHKSRQGLRRVGEAIAYDCSEAQDFQLEILVSDFNDGILYWDVGTHTETIVRDMGFATPDRPQPVKLGVVVTMFNRPVETRRFVERFAASGLADDGHSLLIVNNGEPADFESGPGVSVIANANLGGAGGFTRGLLELRGRGDVTHCLFMDDDGAGHVSSIRKAIAFLAFARSRELAIAGAMFHAEAPAIQFEAGAQVRSYGIRALRAGCDLTNVDELAINEHGAAIDYGAWTFFAFPIAEVRELAFPFFVRGDDILFSLSNRFRIIAPNGVATWQPDFEEKITPSVEYLAQRSEFLIALLRSKEGLVSLHRVIHRSFRQIIADLNALRYGHAGARIAAIEDVLAGPSFWRRHQTPFGRFAEFKASAADEYPAPVGQGPTSSYLFYHARRSQLKMARLVSWLSLGGHLLPSPITMRRLSVNGFHPAVEAALFARELEYVSRLSDRRFTARRSRKRYFALRLRLLVLAAKYHLSARRLREAYRVGLADLTSELSWRRWLGLAAASGKPQRDDF